MIAIILLSYRVHFKKYLMICIQFVISFIVMMFGLYSIEQLFRHTRAVESMTPVDAVHFFVNDENSDFMDERNIEDDRKKDIEQSKSYKKTVEQIQNRYHDTTIGCFEKKDLEINNKYTTLLICDKGALKIFSYTKDNTTIRKYMTGINIPVLISKDLSSEYEIGKVYSFPDEGSRDLKEHQMLVMGVLDDDCAVMTGGYTNISDSEKKAKRTIIAPEFKPLNSDYVYETNIIAISDHADYIKNIFAKNGWKMEYMSIRNELKEYYERNKDFIIFSVGFSSVLIMLCLIGSIGTLLSVLLARFDELGIYIMLGMPWKNVLILLIGEISFAFTLSYMISIIFFTLFALFVGYMEFIPYISYMVTFAVSLVCVIVSVMPVALKFRKYSPIEFLGRSI